MYVSITQTKNGKDAILYAEGNGKGHNGQFQRNLRVTPINLLPGENYAEQMAESWKLARKNHKVQMLRIVCSFSEKELDPDKEEDIEKANYILKSFVKNKYPGHEAVIYLQSDGKGHKLHGHILISDVNMDTHKGCSNEQKHVAHVRRWLNKEASNLIDLDKGEKSYTKRTRTERVLAEKAKNIKEKNLGKSEEELRDILISEGAYSYKEDLRNRIQKAAIISTNEDEFMVALEKSGITVARKTSRKYGEYYKYTFVECPVNILHKTISSKKLGYAFSPEGIAAIWSEKDNTKENKQNETISGFNQWLISTGQSYMSFDDNGRLTRCDFDKMQELHEMYEDSLINSTVTTDTKEDKEETNEIFTEMVNMSDKNTQKVEEVKSRRREMKRRINNNTVDNLITQNAANLLLAQRRAAAAQNEINIESPNEGNKQYDFSK